VRTYFFDFPLEQIHPWAKSAAIAGRCIFRQSASAYWGYHDWVFENQSAITADNFKTKVLEFARTKDKDIDQSQMTACLDARATEADVEKSRALGQSLAVNQTPTIFINGRRLAGSTAWNDLKFIIDYEIGYQKIARNAGEDCGCDVRLPTFDGGRQSGGKPASGPATLHR
jgi:protein-disulfide isomerase